MMYMWCFFRTKKCLLFCLINNNITQQPNQHLCGCKKPGTGKYLPKLKCPLTTIQMYWEYQKTHLLQWEREGG